MNNIMFSGIFKAYTNNTQYEAKLLGTENKELYDYKIHDLYQRGMDQIKEVSARTIDLFTPFKDQFFLKNIESTASIEENSALYELLDSLRRHLIVQGSTEGILENISIIPRETFGSGPMWKFHTKLPEQNYKFRDPSGKNFDWEFAITPEHYMLTSTDALNFWEEYYGLGSEIETVETAYQEITPHLNKLFNDFQTLDPFKPSRWQKLKNALNPENHQDRYTDEQQEILNAIETLIKPFQALQVPLLNKQADLKQRNLDLFNERIQTYFETHKASDSESGLEAAILKY